MCLCRLLYTCLLLDELWEAAVIGLALLVHVLDLDEIWALTALHLQCPENVMSQCTTLARTVWLEHIMVSVCMP